MFEGLGARTRSALQHGAEGAARLRGEWAAAGRQVYHDAIREGREVAARTERELEDLGRTAMAEAAEFKLQAQAGVRDVRHGLVAGKARVDRATSGTLQAVRRVGSTSARVLADMGGQIAAGQKLEREVIAPATADIAGKAWSAPNTLVGLLYGGAGHVAGLATGAHPRPYVALGANAVQFRNNPLGGAGAITLGNTTTYDGDPADLKGGWAWYHATHAEPVWEHERQHTIQAQQLGPLYLPSNLLGGGLALLRDRDLKGERDWHGPTNWNERGPQQTPPRPWPGRPGR